MIKSISLDPSALETPVNVGASKAKTLAYWLTTGVVAFCMTGGVFELMSSPTTVEGITKLGYPSYIIPALGLGKVLAIFALLWPGLPRLKEWAYAGVFFNMLGALVSHIAHDDPAWTIVVSVSIAALTLASWALRPQSRRLGERVAQTERQALAGTQ